jgi:hypothetical protein
MLHSTHLSHQWLHVHLQALHSTQDSCRAAGQLPTCNLSLQLHPLQVLPAPVKGVGTLPAVIQEAIHCPVLVARQQALQNYEV